MRPKICRIPTISVNCLFARYHTFAGLCLVGLAVWCMAASGMNGYAYAEPQVPGSNAASLNAGSSSGEGDVTPSQVIIALSGRHLLASVNELEQMAGGEDELVATLLKVRRMDSPPALGIRAQKLLMTYANRPEVAAALSDDMDSASYTGLARVLTVHLDSLPNESLRLKLGKQAIERAGRDKSFLPYAKTLINSQDVELSGMARAKLGGSE